jgi:hypothetical protein
VCLACLGLIGCAVVADRLTPTEKVDSAIVYAKEDPNKVGITIPILGKYVSLYKAKQLLEKGQINHHTFQQGLVRQAEDDTYLFQGQWNAQNKAIEQAQQSQTAVIAILTGIGSLYFGKNALKRKGDSSPEEVQAKISTVKDMVWDECEKYLKEKGLLVNVAEIKNGTKVTIAGSTTGGSNTV